MKIIQFMASSKWGGAEKVFVDLSNELSKRHEVLAVVLRETEYIEQFTEQVEIIELQSHPTTHNPLLLLELYRIIKQKRPDIVHTHAFKASYLIHGVNRFTKVKHLGTKHNARKGRIFSRLRYVSAVSEEARNSVKQKADAVVRVIHNGIVPRTAIGVAKNEVFDIAAIGRLDAIKGFDILIDQVWNLPFPFRLRIVGEGKEYNNLQRKIAGLNLEDRVILSGFSTDIPEIMKGADLMVISSHSEGFPQVMVEALFYGNVLISTPVGGVKEVLPALLLEEQNNLGRKIEDVYGRYSHYASCFKELQERRAEDFHLLRITEQYENYYAEILG